MYRDIFYTKYGKAYIDDMSDMVRHPPELLVDQTEYGPNSRSTAAMSESCSPKVWKSVQSVATAYESSNHNLFYQEWLKRKNERASSEGEEQNQSTDGNGNDKKHQMTLTPTLFWYDNVHVCETAHYRDFVFHPSYKMVARGGFVEDKLSPVMIRTCERLGLKDGHSRFGCFLLDDHSGYFFTGHLDGGSYLTPDQKKASYPTKQQQQQQKKSNNTKD